jgi:hypothetical protein
MIIHKMELGMATVSESGQLMPYWTQEYMKVTPEIARFWLENWNKKNRPFKQQAIKKYTASMEKDRWSPCSPPIIVCDDGHIGDGQNRLAAVIRSGTTQFFVFWFGVKRKDLVHLDTGARRTAYDGIKCADEETDLTPTHITASVKVHTGKRNNSFSNEDQLICANFYRESVQWAIDNVPAKLGGKTRAFILPVVARAYIHIKHKKLNVMERDNALKRLAEFGKVFHLGSQSPEDYSCILLKAFLYKPETKQKNDNPGGWRHNFCQAQNALYHFMNRQQISTLKSTGKKGAQGGFNYERYPLPNECKCPMIDA